MPPPLAYTVRQLPFADMCQSYVEKAAALSAALSVPSAQSVEQICSSSPEIVLDLPAVVLALFFKPHYNAAA